MTKIFGLLRRHRWGFLTLLDPSWPFLGALPPCVNVHQLSTHHPQVGQCKDCHEFGRVLERSTLSDPHVAEWTLDDAKRMPNLGADTRLDLLESVHDGTLRRISRQCPAFVGDHGHLPAHAGLLVAGFLTLVHASVAHIGKHIGLLAGQQRMGLHDIVDISGCSRHGAHQARPAMDPEAGMYAEVPLIVFLGRSRLRHVEPLLQEVNAQYHGHCKRVATVAGRVRWCVRFNERHELGPRHDPLHLMHKRTPTCNLDLSLKPRYNQAHLFHAAIVRQTCGGEWGFAEFL
jgi:hypothetical protein